MKAILTVIGKDQVGIIAGVSTTLKELNINILDVTQTIMQDYFTMIMVTDLSNSTHNFDYCKDSLLKIGKDLGVEVKIQRQEIFDSMHTL